MSNEDKSKKKGKRPEDRGEEPYKGGRNPSGDSPKENKVKPPWTRGANQDTDFLINKTTQGIPFL